MNQDDFEDTRLVRDGDTLTLSFQTSERLSTSLDIDGSREPVVHFLSGTDEIKASRITIQDGNTDGKSWKAELDIDESVAALEDKEGFLGFKIRVFDKSGNEREVRFEDDGSALNQNYYYHLLQSHQW